MSDAKRVKERDRHWHGEAEWVLASDYDAIAAAHASLRAENERIGKAAQDIAAELAEAMKLWEEDLAQFGRVSLERDALRAALDGANIENTQLREKLNARSAALVEALRLTERTADQPEFYEVCGECGNPKGRKIAVPTVQPTEGLPIPDFLRRGKD